MEHFTTRANKIVISFAWLLSLFVTFSLIDMEKHNVKFIGMYILIHAIVYASMYVYGVKHASNSRTRWTIGYVLAATYCGMFFLTCNVSDVILVAFIGQTIYVMYEDVKIVCRISIGITFCTIILLVLQLCYFNPVQNPIIYSSFILTLLGIYMLFVARMSDFLAKKKAYQMEETKKREAELLNVLNVLSSTEEQLTEVAKATVTNVIDSTNSANLISESIMQVSNATEEISSSTQTQSSSITTIQSHLLDLEDNFKDVQCQIIDSLKSVTRGTESMKEVVDGTVIVTEIGKQVTESLDNLNTKFNAITGIINVIDNIASETKLLSLNASIEAARNGESGKGFAVVANEIGNLAKQSTDSTLSITQIITELGTMISETSKVIHKLSDITDNQRTSIMVASSAFTDINANVSIVDANTSKISEAITDINTLTGDIVADITSLSAITEENTASVQEINALVTNNRDSLEHIQDDIRQLNTLIDTLNGVLKTSN